MFCLLWPTQEQNVRGQFLGWRIDIIMLCCIETNLKSHQNCDSGYQMFETNLLGNNNTKGNKHLLWQTSYTLVMNNSLSSVRACSFISTMTVQNSKPWRKLDVWLHGPILVLKWTMKAEVNVGLSYLWLCI